jgi:signal transduction histidine kinase
MRGITARTPAHPRSLSLADHVRRVADSRGIGRGRRVHVELDLARNLPELELEASALDQLVEALLDAALDGIGEEWGFVTLATGRTLPARGHVSRVHPVVARPFGLAERPHLFLEVHDTGRTLSPDALARVRRDAPHGSPREIALARSRRLADELGATLSLDSTPGCGHQSLVLFPLARS